MAREHGFSLYTALGAIVQSCAALQRGELQAGLATMAEALSAYRATGTRLFLPFFLSFLAEGYLQVGRIQDGLQVVAEALQLTATNLDRFWEAELYRLKGELLLRMGERKKGRKGEKSPHSSTPPSSHSSPEACFQQAIEVMRSQGAKSLELRAVMSLSRLWQQQGKQDQAKALLTASYGWFSEGFATKDLQEARTLLADLS